MKRVEKYNENTEEIVILKREKKNKNIYQQLENEEIDYNVALNARVIGESQSSIDVGRIKEILEKNYQEFPKRNPINFRVEENPVEDKIEKTKEYDINTILEKAKEEKEVNYEQDRFKKVRDTQYNILKNLDFKDKEEVEEEEKPIEQSQELKIKSSSPKTNAEILDLINTININELQDTDDVNPLDILSDLKGHDDTALLGAEELTKEIEKEKLTEKPKEVSEDSFYSQSMAFNKEDFEDLYDKKNNSWIFKLIAAAIALLICIAIIVFLNAFLHLGWF